LVQPAKVDGATVDELLENLKLPEYRTRYRTRREIREHTTGEVLPRLKIWVEKLDSTSSNYEQYLLEALWVSWGLNKVDQPLLRQLLHAKDHHVRAATVEVIRFAGNELPDKADLLTEAARDPHGRVILEAIVSATWLEKDAGLRVLAEASKKPLDTWMADAYETAFAHLNGHKLVKKKADEIVAATPTGINPAVMAAGKEIFMRDASCATCHQPDGKGLTASGFPPLAGSNWVTGNEDRLIKLVLKGIYGPIVVNGKKYPGQVPMTPFGGMLKDDELASVLTYVRNSFGNKAPAVSAKKVKEVRAATKNKTGFYTPDELLKQHPN
jgi:mono/diheme cytochrome c family protein